MNITPHLLRLWRWGALLYVAGSIGATVEWGVSVFVIGMFLRAIFDGITGDAQTGLSVYTVIVIFMVVNWLHNAALRPATSITADWIEGVLQSFVQRNLLRTILDRPPLRNGPGSGEMINRFRDDVEAVVDPMFMAASMTGLAVSMGAALYVMVSVNPGDHFGRFPPGHYHRRRDQGARGPNSKRSDRGVARPRAGYPAPSASSLGLSRRSRLRRPNSWPCTILRGLAIAGAGRT